MVNSTRTRVLYVEDEPALCELFGTVLEPLGYDVDFAYTGTEGLKKHAAEPFDILALDYQLPDMTGLDVAKQVLAENEDLSVIMITGRGNEKIAAEALTLGVSNYIVKDSQEAYIELLPSIVVHLERRAKIVQIMRESADALKEAEEQSKQQFFTQLDTAERFETQARELALLAEELTAANEKLANFANHDELTGLPNARLCKDRLRIAIATARRFDCEVALMHVDLENFKAINTRFGRASGDAVLREIGERLRGCVRDMDTAARLRSDRFALVVSSFEDRETVTTVAQRIQSTLTAPFKVDERDIPVTIRVGMAIYPEHGSTVDDLLNHAELSMHDGAIYQLIQSSDGAEAEAD